MISKILILLLPALALSEITVEILGGQNSRVNFFGSTTDIISDAERGTFRIHDNDLKNAVDKLARGRPSDAYVKSPTPWDDLYRRFGWSEVRRTLKVRSARVLGIQSQPIIVAKKNFHNRSPRPATYAGDISHVEDNTATHKWTKSGSLTVGQKINYKVDVGVGSVGGTTSFSYKSTFGEEKVNTVQVKLGSKASISITLQPGQSAVAELTASKGTMDVEVEYEASLEGSVATNYGNKHNGHYFWSFDINSVLDAGGLPRTVVWKEHIHIGFFSDERVTAYDSNGRPM
ncbi:U-megalopygitoxin(8)-Mo12-like [Choristoneura fumiferana]|uniref:U-megalopygitoxin(8)-Mo12-like n=1 Tax=Choristoneura fumiferana TaxID=7141 RepID=UPI003D1594B8